MFSGQAAIDYLAREAIKDDPSASSHWRQQRAEFKFNGDNFFGLKGFGGARKIPYGLRLWISEIPQLRFFDNNKALSRVRKLLFYCCNHQEKKLPDGNISRFADYPWGDDQLIVDSLFPWHQNYYSIIPPFYRAY